MILRDGSRRINFITQVVEPAYRRIWAVGIHFITQGVEGGSTLSHKKGGSTLVHDHGTYPPPA